MDEFTKVERLVTITGASYEDARNALKCSDGDIVDAMVYLEQVGKVAVKTANVDPRFAPISEAEIAAAAAKREAESYQKSTGTRGMCKDKKRFWRVCKKDS